MVFSSHLFLFYFLPLALALYYATPRRGRNLLLTLVSYLFYGWTNPAFMGLMLLSTLVDYASGLGMTAPGLSGLRGPLPPLEPGAPRTRRQKTWLWISLASNLSLLGFFKYFNFLSDNVAALAALLGLTATQLEPVLRVTLPLGISFYTFQSMSYTIDVYRGHARPLKNFIDFACFISMFPQLVAGPIIRFGEVASQLVDRTLSLAKVSRGAAFFCVGLAKKVLLANPCGKIADTVFDASTSGAVDAWYGVTAYAFQIYFDFSGYSDMAIGLGLMLGFVFPRNFDAPYRSASITEFWRRWHISLSSWMRDYLYIPLGGNRGSGRRTYVNLMVVMLLAGLWHGAAWNFLVWGGIHGLLLTAELATGKRSIYGRIPRPMQVATTFMIVLFAWVFFRADSLGAALEYCARMVGLGGETGGAALVTGLIYKPYYLSMMAVSAVIVWGGTSTWEWTRELRPHKIVAIVALFWTAVALLTTQSYNPFIYFIF
jgi:alginate O-acetyltransferase complex protein AlgI